MIHLIVFLIKQIVKAINGNNSSNTISNSKINTNTMSSNISNSNNNNYVPHSKVTVSNKKSMSEDEKMIYSFLLGIFISCCCGFGFIVNIVLAFITKKVPHIIATMIIATLIVVFGILTYLEENKIEDHKVTSTEEVFFNDTLTFDMNQPELARLKMKTFLKEKYFSWMKDTASSESDLSAEMMTYTLFSHEFDSLYINNILIENYSLDNAMYITDNVQEDNSITDEAIKIDESTSTNEDMSEVTKVVKIYLQQKDKDCLEQDEKDLKEGTYYPKKNKFKDAKDNIFMIPIAILVLISLLYSFYLWYSFFNRNKDANKDMIDDMNNSRNKPLVTFANKTNPTNTANNSNKSTDYNSPSAAIPNTNTNSNTSSPKMPNMAKGNDATGKKIAINSVDVYNLMTIPTLNYSQALLIITERNNNGRYTSIEDIKNRNSLSDDTINEFAKYIYID